MAEEFSKVIKKKSIFAQLGSVNYMSARSSEWGPNTTPEGFTQNMNESKLVSYTSPDDEMIVTTTSLLDNVKNFSRHIIIGPGQDIFSNVAAVGFITRKSLPGRYSIQRKSDYRYITSNNTYTYPPLLLRLLPPPLNRIDEIGDYDGTTSLIKQPREYIENLQEQKKTGVNFFSNWSSDGFSTYRSPLGKYGIQYISDFKGISLLTKTFTYPTTSDPSLPYTFTNLKNVGTYTVNFFSGRPGLFGDNYAPFGFTTYMNINKSELVKDRTMTLSSNIINSVPYRSFSGQYKFLNFYAIQNSGQNFFVDIFAKGFIVNKGKNNGIADKYFINTGSDYIGINLTNNKYVYPKYTVTLPSQFKYINELDRFDEIRDTQYQKNITLINWETVEFNPNNSSYFSKVSEEVRTLDSYYKLASESKSRLGYRHTTSDETGQVISIGTKEPFFIREIPKSKILDLDLGQVGQDVLKSISGLANNILPLRGTIFEVLKSSYEDSVRLTNFFVSPRGIKFFANQTLLHLMSPRPETFVGLWTTTLPATLLASAIGSQFGARFYRHGSPFGLIGLSGGVVYTDSNEVNLGADESDPRFGPRLPSELIIQKNNRLVYFYDKMMVGYRYENNLPGKYGNIDPAPGVATNVNLNISTIFGGTGYKRAVVSKPSLLELNKRKNSSTVYRFRDYDSFFNMTKEYGNIPYDKLKNVDESYDTKRYYTPNFNVISPQRSNDDREFDIGYIVFQNVGGNEKIAFRAIIDSYSDTYSPAYANINYLGNPITYPVYQNMKRTLSFTFKVPIYHGDEISLVQHNIKSLKNFTYPAGFGTKIQTPFLYLQLYSEYVMGVITSLTYTIENTTPWLHYLYENDTVVSNAVPVVASVSVTFDCIPIKDIPSATLGTAPRGYVRDPNRPAEGTSLPEADPPTGISMNPPTSTNGGVSANNNSKVIRRQAPDYSDSEHTGVEELEAAKQAAQSTGGVPNWGGNKDYTVAIFDNAAVIYNGSRGNMTEVYRISSADMPASYNAFRKLYFNHTGKTSLPNTPWDRSFPWKYTPNINDTPTYQLKNAPYTSG